MSLANKDRYIYSSLENVSLILFNDIETIDRKRGMVTEKVIIRLRSGEVLRIEISGLQKPTEALELAFRRFVRVRSERMGKISIPVSENGEKPTSFIDMKG